MLPYNGESKGIFTKAELLLKYVCAEGKIGNRIFVTDISGMSIKGKAKYRHKQPPKRIRKRVRPRFIILQVNYLDIRKLRMKNK